MIVWYISVAIEISDQEAAEMSNFDSWDSCTINRLYGLPWNNLANAQI